MTDFFVYTHKALLMTMQPRGRRRKGRHEFAYLTIKLVALHAWHVICTSFVHISEPLSSYPRPPLYLCAREHLATNFYFLFPSPNRLFQF